MNGAEGLRIYAMVIKRWSHSKVVRDQMLDDLADIQFDHARVAVEMLYREGREHAPNGAQIRLRIVKAALNAPDWGTVKAEIDRRRRAVGGARWAHNIQCPYGSCDGTGLIAPDDNDDRPKHELTSRYCECREDLSTRIAELTGIHWMVDEFIRVVGRAEIAALDGDRVAEAQVRTKWEAHVKRVQAGTVFHGLDTAGLPELEQLRRETAVRAGLMPTDQQGLRKPSMRQALQTTTTPEESEAA